MTEYSAAFRERMVQRMTGPRAMSATALAAEVGVRQPTLSRWLREASIVEGVAKTKKKRQPEARPASQWSAEEKFQAVMEAAALSETALGEWLRRKGLHEEDLARLRDEVRAAATGAMQPQRVKGGAEQKRIKELERELKRSKAALAETAALLVLRKKAVALWGEEGDDT